MLGFNSLSYREIVDTASAMLRCFYYNNYEKDPNMRNYNQGKAMAYAVVLSKLGYSNFVQKLEGSKGSYNEKRWTPIWKGDVDSYDERGRWNAVIFIRKTLLEDALEHIRTTKVHFPSYEGMKLYYEKVKQIEDEENTGTTE
jgi:hypothetical protein